MLINNNIITATGYFEETTVMLSSESCAGGVVGAPLLAFVKTRARGCHEVQILTIQAILSVMAGECVAYKIHGHQKISSWQER